MNAPRILVVEDNRDSRDMLVMLLRMWGFDVEAAADGRSGVEKAARWAPSVALLDIGLPGLDGYEVARQLRKLFGAHVLILALTAYTDIQPDCRGLFDGHFVKPAEPERLHNRLLAYAELEEDE